jgi:hypothetical protein
MLLHLCLVDGAPGRRFGLMQAWKRHKLGLPSYPAAGLRSGPIWVKIVPQAGVLCHHQG